MLIPSESTRSALRQLVFAVVGARLESEAAVPSLSLIGEEKHGNRTKHERGNK